MRWPYGAAAWAPIHKRDIAAVAVRTLTEEGHGGMKYALTGPELLSQVDHLRAIEKAIGRPLHFEEISPESARQQMLAFLPPGLVDVVLDAWAKLVTEPALVTTRVADVTGTPARTFREWATDHAGDFHFSARNEFSHLHAS